MENPDLIPQTSIWPIFLALGLSLLVAGVVYSPIVSAIGLVMFLVSLGGWLQENRTLTRIFTHIEEERKEFHSGEEEVPHE